MRENDPNAPTTGSRRLQEPQTLISSSSIHQDFLYFHEGLEYWDSVFLDPPHTLPEINESQAALLPLLGGKRHRAPLFSSYGYTSGSDKGAEQIPGAGVPERPQVV